jgi:hypothetical protein
MTLEALSILYTARFEPPKCSRNQIVDLERNDTQPNSRSRAPVETQVLRQCFHRIIHAQYTTRNETSSPLDQQRRRGVRMVDQ